ncbi:MAG TPA: hypothetical protein VGO67_10545 [Verrucomicrobiae bacterium]
MAAGTLLIIFVYFGMRQSQRHKFSKEDVTRQTIRHCEWIERKFSDMAGTDFASYARSNQAAGRTLPQIFHAIVAYPQNLPTNRIDAGEVPLSDAWGRPLNFLWSDHARDAHVCDSLIRKNLPILIWSSGANGSNELGQGDDVIADGSNGGVGR